MRLMLPKDYPPQEPVSAFAQAYTDDLIRRIDPNSGENFFYGNDPYQSIALFKPKRPNGTVIGFIHGGGWTNGYKEMMGYMAPAFTAQGFLFACIGYRLAPTALLARLFRRLRGRGGVACWECRSTRRRS